MQFTKSFFALLAVVGVASAFDGGATYYDPGLGACGQTNDPSESVVALSTAKYGNGSNCGKRIRVNYKGKSTEAKVVDKCPGCASNDIDLSPAAFSQLANKDLGRIKVSWNFI